MSVNKKTIVLLPGWLHNFENETKFIHELQKYFNVVTIKYPGYYGIKELNNLPVKYDLPKYVYSKLKRLKSKSYYLLGFSMGCQVVLHLVNKYNLKNKIILISPTAHSLEDEAPFLIKPFLRNIRFFKFIRNSNFLSKLLVNMAYRKIFKVTENKQIDKTVFDNPNITTKGAFDTLYFLTTCFVNPIIYRNQATFIFGEKEILQKKFAGKYKTIKNMGHGGIDEHYKELSNIIKSEP